MSDLPYSEQRTRALFQPTLSQELNSEFIMVRKVFVTMHANSLDLQHICSIASAIYRVEVDEERMKIALNMARKLHILRTRRHGGKTLWEVNL